MVVLHNRFEVFDNFLLCTHFKHIFSNFVCLFFCPCGNYFSHIENIVPELTARGYKKAFVCSDPDLIKFGVTKKVTDLLDAANFAYAVYSEIKPNPTIANVQDGVAAFKAAEADCIVTIGGGSSMDTEKAIGIIINNPEFADVRSLEGVAPTKKHAVFTIAVPTTAGTAAEVTFLVTPNLIRSGSEQTNAFL